MNTIFKIVGLISLLAISACSITPKKEIPQDGEGSDAMRPSPCVGAPSSPCAPMNYDGRGYTWRT